MPQRPTLTIPKPCHENWQAMSPAAQGRHCAACNTVVVDFTRMSDAEVLAFLGQPSGGTCGRFRQEQLNRPLIMPLSAPMSEWRTRLLALAALLGLGVATAPDAHAQRTSMTGTKVSLAYGMVEQSTVPAPTLPPLMIRGVVRDSATQVPLPGVTILVPGTTIGIGSDENGKFELVLPETFREQDSVRLQASSIGYEPQVLSVSIHGPEFLAIILNPSHRMLAGELIVVGGFGISPWYSPRGMWQRIKRPFQRWSAVNQ